MSVRSTCGSPRVSASPSRTRVTGKPPSDRAGTTATASVVASSTMVRHLDTGQFCRAIEDEVRRPHLVRRLGAYQRLPIGQRHLLAAAAPHLEPRLGVETIDAFVIGRGPALLSQLQVDHAGAVASMSVRKRHDAVAEARVGIRPRLVTVCRRAHTHDG